MPLKKQLLINSDGSSTIGLLRQPQERPSTSVKGDTVEDIVQELQDMGLSLILHLLHFFHWSFFSLTR